MYAIIRAGGKQAKVELGDVIDIERVKGDNEELTFAPLLVVDDEGESHSDREKLSEATVTGKVLGETQGEKIDIFKYKNKTGYRRHQGHRQKYTRVEITGINLPGAKKTTAGKTTAKSGEEKAEEKPAAKKPAAKSETKTAAAKKPAAKKPAAKDEMKAAAAKKPTAKKPAAKKTSEEK